MSDARTIVFLPEGGALVYLSLGSLGSADVALMQRLVDLLATTEHRVIVSKGPLAAQITLHGNQTGEGSLPQPAILPQVDETGFGRRLATYDFCDEELTDAIDEMLADASLGSRLTVVSSRLKANPGTVRAADLIERVARTGEPVARNGVAGRPA